MHPDHTSPRRPSLLRPFRPRTPGRARRFRRGAYLLPSMFTMANMFCGYACIVLAMRGEFEPAALLIGVAFVLDMLDGRIARMTGTSSAFGVQFDSLADVISFGVAPAILSFTWGLEPLGRLGWAAGFLFVAAAAVRLARFNIQSGTQDKRYFVGMPSPAAACVPAATVFAYPTGFQGQVEAVAVLSMVIVPALLMVSAIRYRSFKTFDLQSRRSYPVLFLLASPQVLLLALAYVYLSSGLIGVVWHRTHRKVDPPVEAESAAPITPASSGGG